MDSKNVVNLDLKKDEKILNFSDFQKQSLKFDIAKLQEAYNQIVQTKKFDDGGGISHFGAICLTPLRFLQSRFPSGLTSNQLYNLLRTICQVISRMNIEGRSSKNRLPFIHIGSC